MNDDGSDIFHDFDSFEKLERFSSKLKESHCNMGKVKPLE
jgi:hypothetical protein